MVKKIKDKNSVEIQWENIDDDLLREEQKRFIEKREKLENKKKMMK